MKAFTALWLDTPRWVRGLLLGNLWYVVLMGFGYGFAQNGSGVGGFFFPAFLLVREIPLDGRYILFHAIYCVVGALSVQWLGEKKGMLVLLSLIYGMAIIYIIIIIVWLSFFSNWRI